MGAVAPVSQPGAVYPPPVSLAFGLTSDVTTFGIGNDFAVVAAAGGTLSLARARVARRRHEMGTRSRGKET
jgi:hypothetical protein